MWIYNQYLMKQTLKTFPGVIYINKNVPEKFLRVLLSQKKFSELPGNSDNIFKRNILEIYLDRPYERFLEWKIFFTK